MRTSPIAPTMLLLSLLGFSLGGCQARRPTIPGQDDVFVPDGDAGNNDDPFVQPEGGGEPVSCGVEFPPPEDCNGLDDDCDGLVDEDLRPNGPCTTTCGSGELQCISPAWTCIVTSGPFEICNGLDDNCNGVIDEGIGTRVEEFSCNIQECRAGIWETVGSAPGTSEECNGIDDDCNGRIDDGLDFRACIGCAGLGVERCVGGVIVCGTVIPLPEICDNRDNNCNGDIDEGVTQECPCGTGYQTCVAGTFTGPCQLCVAGTARWCDDPTYCHWGRQTCQPDGHWGTCVEVTDRPAGCSGDVYNTGCCVSAGECCQDYAHGSDGSVGNCATQCTP